MTTDNNRLQNVASDFFNDPVIPLPRVKPVEIPKSSKVVKTTKPKVEKLVDILIEPDLKALFELTTADLQKKTIHLRPDQIDDLQKYLFEFKKKHRSLKAKEMHFIMYLIDFAIAKIKEEKVL